MCLGIFVLGNRDKFLYFDKNIRKVLKKMEEINNG